MPSDPWLRTHDWTRRTEPADLPEWMDEPCPYEELQACLRDLGQVNRLTLGIRPTLHFLDRLLQPMPEAPRSERTLRILDVGFGGGDALFRMARWARTRRVTVELTGIDLHPFAARAARERYPDAAVRWLTGDAFSYEGEADVVVSSLLTHHLPTPEVVRFVRWMERTAIRGWFINDLGRSRRAASLFAVLARVMRWHRFVRHDGPVSFARSFAPADWQRLLAEAGVPAGAAVLENSAPGRLCVGRLK